MSTPSKNAANLRNLIAATMGLTMMIGFTGCGPREDPEKVALKKEVEELKAERDIAFAAAEQSKSDATRAADQAARASKIAEENAQPETTAQVRFDKPGMFSNETGQIAYISNRYRDAIEVTAAIRRPSTGASKSYSSFVVDSSAKSIGEGQGWAFLSGDTITISQPGHKSLMWTAP